MIIRTLYPQDGVTIGDTRLELFALTDGNPVIHVRRPGGVVVERPRVGVWVALGDKRQFKIKSCSKSKIRVVIDAPHSVVVTPQLVG